MTTLAEQILAADDLPIREVEIPEWGVTVYVRTLMGFERDMWEKEFPNMMQPRAQFAQLVLCDSVGHRLYGNSVEERDALSKKAATALDKILVAGVSHNKFDKEQEESLLKN